MYSQNIIIVLQIRMRKRRGGEEVEYEVKKIYAGKPIPQEVEVSFRLDYPGWCKLKESVPWHRMEEAVACLQRAQEP